MAAVIVGTGRTPAGTAFTTFRESVATAGTVYWSVATALIGETGVPLCLYTHGAGGGADQFHTIDSFLGIRSYLLDHGVVIVEGTGGGTQPWANDASKAAYEATWQHLADLYQPETTFGLFRSMGGLVGQWLLTQSPVVAPYMQGAMVNSGVQDLMWAYQSGSWTAAMNSAWGVSSYSQFQSVAADSNPMYFLPSKWAGKTMLQLVGTADDLVPMGPNGMAMRNRYASQITNHPNDLDVRQGGDHSTTNGSYLQTTAMAAFVDRILGIEPGPPATPQGFFRVISGGVLIGGDWRRIKSVS